MPSEKDLHPGWCEPEREAIRERLDEWVCAGRGRLDSDDWADEDILEARKELEPLLVELMLAARK